jgi:3-phosphoshikimate 1-carboxyvinyltransferase
LGDVVEAMHKELEKLGGGLVFGDNTVTVPKQELKYCGKILNGHNDHRIVMASAVMAAVANGQSIINGSEAIVKSYPEFFKDYKKLGGNADVYV